MKFRLRKILCFIVSILICFFLYWATIHVVFPLVRFSPDPETVDKYVKNFIGMKVPENLSKPLIDYRASPCDGVYYLVFDADQSWRDAFIKKFNLVENSEIKREIFRSGISPSKDIMSKIPSPIMIRMISMKEKEAIKWNNKLWNIDLLMDPEGTLCFLRILEGFAHEPRDENSSIKQDINKMKPVF